MLEATKPLDYPVARRAAPVKAAAGEASAGALTGTDSRAASRGL